MTETLQDRWRRLHAAGMVRWMPGMASTDRRRVLALGNGHVGVGQVGWEAEAASMDEAAWDRHKVPDFTDPATLGCLLAMAREALEDVGAAAVGDDTGWRIDAHYTTVDVSDLHGSATEAEALLDAIERAHGAHRGW